MPPQTEAHKAKLSAAMKAYHRNHCNTDVPYVKPERKKKPKKGEEGYVAPVKKAKAPAAPKAAKKVPPPVAPKPKKKVPPPVAPKPKKKETHKMPDGTTMSGAKHTADSKPVPRTTKKGFGIKRIKKGFGIKRIPVEPTELSEKMTNIFIKILGEEEFDTLSEFAESELDEISGPWEDPEEFQDLYEAVNQYYEKINDSNQIYTLLEDKGAKALIQEIADKIEIMEETVDAFNEDDDPSQVEIKKLKKNPKIIYP